MHFIFNLNITKAIPKEDVKNALDIYKVKNNNYKLYCYNNCNNDNFGYYISGILSSPPTLEGRWGSEISVGATKILERPSFKVICYSVTLPIITRRKKSFCRHKPESSCTDLVV